MAVSDHRASHCQVCKERFSYPPPTAPSLLDRLLTLAKSSATLACVGLLVAGLTGPPWPWPHVILCAVLLGTRAQSMIGALALSGCLSLVALWTRGMRLTLRVDGEKVGLHLIRFGAPIQGLAPGSLLASAASLEPSIFSRSVVLLIQHAPASTRGVILNRPIDALALGLVPSAGPSGSDSQRLLDEAIREPMAEAPPGRRHLMYEPAEAQGPSPDLVAQHFLGGPVGLGVERVYLHSCPGLTGARLIVPGSPSDADAAPHPPVYEGGLGIERLLGQGNRGSSGGFFTASSIGRWLFNTARQGAAHFAPAPADGLPSPSPAAETKLPEASSLGLTSWAASWPLLPAPAPREERLTEDYLARARASCHGRGVNVYHGVSVWSPAQLEGEIRANVWHFGAAQAGDVALGDRPHPAALSWARVTEEGRVSGARGEREAA